MKKRYLIFGIGLVLGLMTLQSLAGGGPCNYIVLYDQADTNSIAVANYYQQVRNIPERNMVPYTFFPAGRTTYARTHLWDLTVYLRQVIQDRGLAGRFNGIAVAGAVPLLGSSLQVGFQSGLYFSPGDITNRYWSFGDGATTNTIATTVSHTYTSVGTNTVQLIVSGPAGASTNIQVAAVEWPVVDDASVW